MMVRCESEYVWWVVTFIMIGNIMCLMNSLLMMLCSLTFYSKMMKYLEYLVFYKIDEGII